MKKFLKRLIPKFLLNWYHLAAAKLANFVYRRPSEKLIVIGVTGTNGKSTTVNLIAKILDEAGFMTAATSTVNFKMGKRTWLNDLKMTMPGRFFLQRFFRQAIKDGCNAVVVEASSEGILQHRNLGIHFDALVFTNLTPEHLEAHKGFENYKQAKLAYFRQLQAGERKILNGKKIDKLIAANIDDPYGHEFTRFRVDRLITFGGNLHADIRAENLHATPMGISFKIGGSEFNLKLKGKFDVYNALAAIAAATGLGISVQVCKQALEKVPGIPGRMELIDPPTGGGQNFRILVDYAPEPESLRQLYETIKSWPGFAPTTEASRDKPKQKIIHVLGSTGGGRDTARRKILGELAGTNADTVIVTNEDPYDDDPQTIINDVAAGALEKGKILGQNLFKILDRRAAIAKALSLAKENDLVVVTGKGAEQKMAVRGGYIPWDDRQVIREEWQKLSRG